MREEVIRSIEQTKLVVIVRGVSLADIVPFAKAIYDGGVRNAEVTFDQTGKCSDEETCEKIRAMRAAVGSDMHIGAGTVLTERQLELAHAAGAEFIISPDTNEAVIRRTRSLAMVSIPGALTPTEIVTADRYGADFVKLFPAGNLGLSYYKAVKAPLSHIKLLYVGGVTLDSLRELVDGGVLGFGIGGAIADKKLIEAGRFDEITALAKQYCDILR